MIAFLDIQKQYLDIQSEIDSAISEVLSRSQFIQSEQCRQFESAFAEYQDAKFCLGVANGTDAIEIAIEALNLPPQSEIIVPANSFIASAEAVTRTGHQVIFCDCDPKNYTIDLKDLEKRISNKTKAIIAVHLYGHPCDMDGLVAIAKQRGIAIIEDCAQAHGSLYKEKKVGAIGDIGAFSFYPGKTLGAYGDGGAIVTNDESLIKRCRMIANHGRLEKYNHLFQGRNSRLDEIQAAVLNVKLRHLDNWIKKRSEVAAFYLKNLKDKDGLVLPQCASWATQAYHLFVIRTSRRDQLLSHLADRKIQTGVHYPLSLPRLKAFEKISAQYSQLWCLNRGEEYLSLPMGEHLSPSDVQMICTAIHEFYLEGK